MTFENLLRLVRQLKGAPLSCLIALSLVQQPVTARFLCAVTGYSAHAITTALDALEALGFATCNSHRSAWRLLAGVQQLPLGPALLGPPDRENRDPSLVEDSIDFKDSTLSLDLRPDREKRDPEDRPDRVFRDPKGDPERGNCTLDPVRILAATEPLFGERVYRLPQPVDPLQMLACIAEVYAKRGRLTHPARAAYRNITQGNWPDEKYQDYRSYLPESFLVACGLAPDPTDASSQDFELERDPDPDPAPPPAPVTEPDPSLLLPIGDGRTTAKTAWQSALAQLELEIPRGAFADYVAPAWLSRYDPLGRIFTVTTRNAYGRDWLESRLNSTLTRLLTGICNQAVTIRFTSEESR